MVRMTTYWLFYGSHIIGSVRMADGMDEATVRRYALDSHRRNPTIYADFPEVNPAEQQIRISCATIKTYEGRN